MGQGSLDELLETIEGEFGLAEEVVEVPYPEYAGDPEGFITEVLGFWLTDQQREICRSVRDERETNVQASHGVGIARASRVVLQELPRRCDQGRWMNGDTELRVHWRRDNRLRIAILFLSVKGFLLLSQKH